MTQTSSVDEKHPIAVASAILIGHLIITVPIIIIFLGIFQGRRIFGDYWLILAIVVFVLAWLWWSYIVPRWRQWAIKKGAPADKLHQAAVATGLEWPKGWIFEKTEFRGKEKQGPD